MKITCTTPHELDERSLDAWRQLQCGAYDSPFFAPEYTQLVAQVRNDVRVAVIEHAGEVGFFPFQTNRLGIGRPVGWRLTDFQGPVLPGNGQLQIPQLMAGCGLVAWHFDHLVTACAPLQAHLDGSFDSPYLDLSGGFEDYCRKRREAGSLAVRQCDRKARKLEREVGPLRFEVHSTESKVFESLVQWKSEQQRRTGTLPVLKMPWVLDLLERIRHTDTPGFAGRLSALFAGDALVAVHLGLRSATVWHWWMATYNHQYERYSPGAVLMMRLAEAAAAQGIQRFDLGKGDEPYKHRYMSDALRVGEGSLGRWPVCRLLGKAWYHSRKQLRASPLRPAFQFSKRMVRNVRYWMRP